MTSVLNVDTIADKAGTGPVGLTKQHAAKAWAHIGPSGDTLPDSFNISSLDDDDTGQYGLNFTNSMGSALYSANMNITLNHSSGVNNVRVPEIESKNASSVEVDSAYVNSSGVWVEYDIEVDASVTVHGDLA